MDDMAEWTDDSDDAGTVRTMRPERVIDFDYDEVSATTENEFLYEVWKRQARKEHAMFPTTDAMMWALFFGDPRITYEVLPTHDPKGYLA
tara:strand:+ start:188 stop:457 length:270 start_codon:yes stop_codon:yes gene_type:complete